LTVSVVMSDSALKRVLEKSFAGRIQSPLSYGAATCPGTPDVVTGNDGAAFPDALEGSGRLVVQPVNVRRTAVITGA
jgi:hypothetical protein